MPAAEKCRAAQLERELATLRDGAALWPLADRAVLAARGEDRASFLQGMLSNEVARLAPGEGTHALLLTEQGRVVAELCVFAVADAIWLELPASARTRVREALEHFVVADDVELDDLAVHGLALCGAGAAAVLAAVVPAHADAIAALGECAHLAFEYGAGVVHVAHTQELGRDGFHVWSADEHSLDAFATALLAAGASPVSGDALELERIRTGWARQDADYDTQTLAAEIPSFARAVSYRKGCYLGQEVMERIAARGHVNWLLVRLTGAAGSSFSAGAQVKDDGADVGRVTSVATLPGEERVLALARVRAQVAQAGRRLVVVEDGRELDVEVATCPTAE
jgi:folate-binding protein YgfZ